MYRDAICCVLFVKTNHDYISIHRSVETPRGTSSIIYNTSKQLYTVYVSAIINRHIPRYSSSGFLHTKKSQNSIAVRDISWDEALTGPLRREN